MERTYIKHSDGYAVRIPKTGSPGFDQHNFGIDGEFRSKADLARNHEVRWPSMVVDREEIPESVLKYMDS